MDVFVGIDPGAKGAICFLCPTNNEVTFFNNTDKPIDLYGKFAEMSISNTYNLRVAMIEDVHAIFGTSAKSNFNFGFNTGLLHGLVLASGTSLDLVTPKTWQKFVGVKKKGKEIKKEVASICDRLYPHVSIRGPKGGLLDGKSDALMIAHYCSMVYK